MRICLQRLKSEDAVIANHEIVEVPRVITAIDTGFPADENNNRLLDIAVMDDNRVWMGGESKELKLFDFQGNLQDTVPISTRGMYLTVHNKQVIYTEQGSNTVYRVGDDKTIETMFTTGEWKPYGITSTASDDLLICLYKDDQSKVVQYNSTGTVLQEIQYDSQSQPLFGKITYIAENVNGDIVVTDWKKKAAIGVDRLGIFRYSYSGIDKSIDVMTVTTDPNGHVFVADALGDKIHMLDRDGRFFGCIIPDQGISRPRAICIVGAGEIIVGERKTGIAKRIIYAEQKK
jgi:sugar lactone lactonase YvrE